MEQKSSAVTKYEQARQALEEYFIQYGTFDDIPELLARRYGTYWADIFYNEHAEYDFESNTYDKPPHPLRNELLDLCFKISQV